MSDTREVFEMVTKQTEPDLNSWRQQERRQRRRVRMRKAGAFVAVGAVAVAGALAYALAIQGGASEPVDQPTPTTARPPGTSGDLASAYVGYIDLATGNTSTIPIITSSSGVDVSPDGTQVAYVDRGTEGVEVVHVADIDGSNIREFGDTASPAGVVGPRWSPDGSSIVYQGQARNGWVGNLYVVDVDSGQVRKITNLDDYEADLYYMAPTFDPTGRTVLFNLEVQGNPRKVDLWSVPVTGGEPALVRRGAYFGDYSPDGSQIAFTPVPKEGPGFGDLWVAPAAGGNGRKLASGEIIVPRWSPAGTRIAYNDGSGGVWVVNVKTGEKSLVLESGRTPEWVDDDTLILTP